MKKLNLPWCYEGILLGLSNDYTVSTHHCFTRPTTTNQIGNRSAILEIGTNAPHSSLRYVKSLAQRSIRQLWIFKIDVDDLLFQII